MRLEIGAIAENIHSLFAAVLYSLSARLELDRSSDGRVSIYVHRAEDSSFVPCGRFSANPLFRPVGRTSFPDNQGCIAKAWQRGWYFSDSFPAPGTKEYIEHMLSQYGVPRNVTRKMKMKPVAIAAMRIQLDSVQVAVIVVEKKTKDRFSEDALKEALGAIESEYARMISAVDKYIPNPQRAKEVGL